MTQYTEKDMTPFFPADVKPTKKGAYQTRTCAGDRLGFQFWTGNHWCFWGFDAEDAERGQRDKSCFQNVQWRGLSFDPSAEAK